MNCTIKNRKRKSLLSSLLINHSSADSAFWGLRNKADRWYNRRILDGALSLLMNYTKLVDAIKSIVARPLVLQIVCAIFVFLIIWQIFYGAVFFRNLNHVVSVHESRNAEDKAVQNNNQTSLKESHILFGYYVPKNLDAGGVRQSQLNLTVVGVILATDEKDSEVILQKPNGEEHFYHVGDKLPGGGVIKRITPKGVLVAREGALERLTLPQEEIRFEAPAEPLK